MTQEDKNLLSLYLCMALPYNVKCHVPTDNCVMTLTGKRLNYFCFHKDGWGIDYSHETETVLDPLNDQHNDYVVKPYLRTLASMTYEEREFVNNNFLFYGGSMCYTSDIYTSNELVLWLLEHHFDYMGLIHEGLAIEVTKENNPYKEGSCQPPTN